MWPVREWRVSLFLYTKQTDAYNLTAFADGNEAHLFMENKFGFTCHKLWLIGDIKVQLYCKLLNGVKTSKLFKEKKRPLSTTFFNRNY